jgi:hypothetical protein
MIDVFETWFNQFTKSEQMKLLKHIRKNHLSMIDDYNSVYSEKIDNRRLIESVPNSANHNVSHAKSRVEK